MAKGQVTITTLKPGPGLALTAWLGDGGPTVTGGFGGWEIVPRPRRVAITQWRGREPIQMELPIVIDGYDGSKNSVRGRDSIELMVTRLERMALPWPPIKTPPKIKLTGSATNLIPHDDLNWVIVEIGMGGSLRNSDGNRTRQEATLSLVSFVGVEKVKLRAAEKQRQKAGRG